MQMLYKEYNLHHKRGSGLGSEKTRAGSHLLGTARTHALVGSGLEPWKLYELRCQIPYDKIDQLPPTSKAVQLFVKLPLQRELVFF